jgi:hypothetical protein
VLEKIHKTFGISFIKMESDILISLGKKPANITFTREASENLYKVLSPNVGVRYQNRHNVFQQYVVYLNITHSNEIE